MHGSGPHYFFKMMNNSGIYDKNYHCLNVQTAQDKDKIREEAYPHQFIQADDDCDMKNKNKCVSAKLHPLVICTNTIVTCM